MIQPQENYNSINADMDVWALIQNGYFEQACMKADYEYNESKNILSLRNKVYALFHLKK